MNWNSPPPTYRTGERHTPLSPLETVIFGIQGFAQIFPNYDLYHEVAWANGLPCHFPVSSVLHLMENLRANLRK